MRLIGVLGAVDGAGHFSEESGIFYVILVIEFPGTAFHLRKLPKGIPLILYAMIYDGGELVFVQILQRNFPGLT